MAARTKQNHLHPAADPDTEITGGSAPAVVMPIVPPADFAEPVRYLGDTLLHALRDEQIGPGGFLWVRLDQSGHYGLDCFPVAELTEEAAAAGLTLQHIRNWNSGLYLEAGLANLRGATCYINTRIPLIRVWFAQRVRNTL